VEAVGEGAGLAISPGGHEVGVGEGAGLAISPGGHEVGVGVGVGVASSTTGPHITEEAIKARIASRGHRFLLSTFIGKPPLARF